MSDNRLKINIDISDTVEEFKLDDDQVTEITETVRKTLMMEIYRNWVDATKALHSTRQGYIRGLQFFDEGNGTGGLKLVGTLNNMLEQGASAFDIKEGMLKSAKVKVSKTGNLYITVPFRFATSGAGGFSEAFSGVLPPSVYNAIRDVAKVTPVGRTPVLKKDNLPEKYKDPALRTAIPETIANKAYDEYLHKSSIYEGLTKTTSSPSGGGRQTQYNTFRRISNLSDPNSWIHKGITQYNLSEEAMRNTDVDTIVNNTVDKMLDAFGF